MRLAPSVYAGDMSRIAEMLADFQQAGCDLVHWDVMDGHFVPNLTYGPPVIASCRPASQLPFDVHLMVLNPADYIERLAAIGVAMATFQVETTNFAPRLIGLIRGAGIAPSVALNPQTPLGALDEILHLVDNVLVMSIDPGFYGQPFLESTWLKLERLSAIRAQRGLNFSIEVDGGVNSENAARLAATGVDIVVAGKAYFTAPDRAAFARLIHAPGEYA
jgi:ribulose-phosphate 3-epimerase